MNFLKKKLKTVVHGGKRNKDADDDDDFDNYVPEVPPHPSTLNEPNGSAAFPSTSNFTNFANFNQQSSSFNSTSDPTSFGSSQVPLPPSLPPLPGESAREEATSPAEEAKLSLEELKAKEAEYKRAEKEKLKAAEDAKKDNAEWAYFLSLTGKVDALTTKTQSVLDKLKDDSAIEEIRNLEDAYLPAGPVDHHHHQSSSSGQLKGQPKATLVNVVAVAPATPKPKAAGGWAAFEEEATFNPADPNWAQQQQKEEQAAPIVVDEKIARELIDDFGFTSLAPGLAPAASLAAPLEALSLAASDQPEVDPFDTSFIDIEAIKSGAALPTKPTELIHNLDFTEAEFDPFDTSHIATAADSGVLLTPQIVTSDLGQKAKEEEEDVK